MAGSPDGKRLVVMTYHGAAHVVDIRDPRKPRVTLTFQAGDDISNMGFLTDTTLVADGKDGRIALWDIRTGTVIRVIRETGEDLFSMDVSPDKTRIAYTTFRSSISIIDAEIGALMSTLGPDGELKETIRDLKFSPDGRRLASSSFAGDLTLWDVERGTVLWTVQVRPGERALVSSGVAGPHYGTPDMVTHMAYSPDGRVIVAGSADGSLAYLEAGTGEIRKTSRFSDNSIGELAFMPDGRSLLVGDAAGRLRRLDMETGAALFSARGQHRIDGLSVGPDGNWISVLAMGGYVVLRDAATGREARDGMERSLWSAVYTKDGKLLAAGANDSSIDLFEMPSGRFLRRIQSDDEYMFDVVFSPDEKKLAARGSSLRMWDVRTGKLMLDIPKRELSFGSFAFSPRGDKLFIEDFRSIGEWDASLGTYLGEFASVSESIDALAVSPDGRYLAAGLWGGQAQVWERASGKSRFLKPDSGYRFSVMSEIAFAPGGRELVGLIKNDGDVYRISIPDGKVIEKRSYGRCVRETVMTPQGLAVVSRDDCKPGKWTVRSAATGKPMIVPTRALASGGEVLAVSPDGREWVFSGEDGVLSVWRLP